ncbi:MAG: DUF6057 family protein [Bacteroidales bacterium]|nr:DUF6057 family protein [Bacteroidales bacterium]
MLLSNSKITKAALYASLLAFIGFVVYILCKNEEVLYAAHDRSEFLYGAPFFQHLMQKPFGLMQYVGAWLTQLFYNPWVGAGVLAGIWLLIVGVGKQAFRLQGGAIALMLLPVACLLTSVVDLGYWIYLSTIRGYWFSQSVAYLIMLLLLWAAQATPRRWHWAWYLVGASLYPILGWFALLFILCLVVSGKLSWRELLGVVIMLCTTSIWHGLLYSNFSLSQVSWAGLPRFVTPSDCTESLTTPFWVLGAVSLLIPLCCRYLNNAIAPVLSAAAGMVFTLSFMFEDKNYINEMRMVRSAVDDNWQEVIDIASAADKPTISMIMLKNVALMHEGKLLDESFKMNGNSSFPLNNPDSIQVSFLEIASPLVYYNYGMVNEAIRLSYECAVQTGFSPFYLKMLARCVSATGEEKHQDRFLALLHHHPYYKDWHPAPVSDLIKEQKQSYEDEITGVENTYSYIVTSVSSWYESDNKLASEQALFYSMLRCDSRRFWRSMRKYVKLHQNEAFPLHAQEAYIMFMDKAPEEKRMMIPVEQGVYNRYKAFWERFEEMAQSRYSKEKIEEEMHKGWGDTYWYYNLFGRKVL